MERFHGELALHSGPGSVIAPIVFELARCACWYGALARLSMEQLQCRNRKPSIRHAWCSTIRLAQNAERECGFLG
jgi:hypothetical protein